jgi:hypothetical protein
LLKITEVKDTFNNLFIQAKKALTDFKNALYHYPDDPIIFNFLYGSLSIIAIGLLWYNLKPIIDKLIN